VSIKSFGIATPRAGKFISLLNVFFFASFIRFETSYFESPHYPDRIASDSVISTIQPGASFGERNRRGILGRYFAPVFPRS
jgi:hypothetical protein